MKIGFIGGGNMGGAILAGYGSADPDNEAKIALFDKSEDVCAKTRERFPKMTICSSGFLIVEKNSEKQHRELNDFSKQLIDLFLRETGLV